MVAPSSTIFHSSAGALERHAIFISAHRDPSLVHRLARSLEHPRIDIFLHVDAKVDVAPFLETGLRHVPFRLHTPWASWSMTESILLWLRMVRPDNYRTYTHLSGQCYPVVSAEALVKDLDHIEGPVQGMNHEPEKHAWRYRMFHVLDKSGVRGFRDRLLKKFLYQERSVRQLPPGIQWAVGCALWTLDRNTISWMLDYLESHPDVERFFRNVFASDETLLPSLLVSSPFADQAGRMGLYYDWSAGGSHPKELDERDLPAIIASGCWFARKMTPGRSDALLDALDAHKNRKDAFNLAP